MTTNDVIWVPDGSYDDGAPVSRKVLRDVQHIIEWLENEEDEFRFRTAVIAAITLLRTVGHALRKVDAARNPELKPIVEQRYAAWKADPDRARIFFEFIEQERNLILKEYEVRIEFSPMITTSEATHAWRVGSNIFCPVASGHYAAQDVRDVLREAVAWWAAELNRIGL
jgi:uncharacterized phage-associated protein